VARSVISTYAPKPSSPARSGPTSRRTERATPFGRCGRSAQCREPKCMRCGRPERATPAGRVSVRQGLFGLCPRSDERAWPEARRALASRVEPTESTEHVLPCA